jgi:hypothetical protein
LSFLFKHIDEKKFCHFQPITIEKHASCPLLTKTSVAIKNATNHNCCY